MRASWPAEHGRDPDGTRTLARPGGAGNFAAILAQEIGRMGPELGAASGYKRTTRVMAEGGPDRAVVKQFRPADSVKQFTAAKFPGAAPGVGRREMGRILI